MATRGASQLTAVCAVASFLWLSRSVAARPLAETPRLSACLLLLVSGLATLGASFFAPWLPGANGRFDSDRSVPLRKGGRPGHASPRRPRRFFLPVLVAAVVLRLEVLRRVVADMQCAAPGVEVRMGCPLVLCPCSLSHLGRLLGSCLVSLLD
ncbi:hypothetical protein VTK73DRAFT_3895 [Phialemonium thermophilum]|uniref:Secreted protein n=1 Tax=Phialemonium thermophilum TaxID=223376 RepID=A0ABR3VDV5_9PEZI